MSQGPSDPNSPRDRREPGNPGDSGGRRFANERKRPASNFERRDDRGGRRYEDREPNGANRNDSEFERVSLGKGGLDDIERFYEPEVKVPVAERLKSKRTKRFAILALVLMLLGLIALFLFRQMFPGGTQGKEVDVSIKEGVGISSVAELLENKHVVPSALGMRMYDKIDFKDVDIKAGEYAFRTNSSAEQAFAVLAKGPKAVVHKLPIPEGQRVKQIATRVGQIQGFSSDKFNEIANSGRFKSRYQATDAKNLEGYLFPDTYILSARENEATLVEQMVAQADNQASLAGIDSSLERTSKTPAEIMIIASMIEAEAKTDGDRAQISRVIYNRLNQGMPLQIDATVLYGIGNTKQSLSRKDLATDTPYNTYTRKGLPPTPICSPGRKSIEAALNPVPGPWLYYVIKDAEGNHAFAATLQEHNANAAAAHAAGLL